MIISPVATVSSHVPSSDCYLLTGALPLRRALNDTHIVTLAVRFDSECEPSNTSTYHENRYSCRRLSLHLRDLSSWHTLVCEVMLQVVLVVCRNKGF